MHALLRSRCRRLLQAHVAAAFYAAAQWVWQCMSRRVRIPTPRAYGRTLRGGSAVHGKRIIGGMQTMRTSDNPRLVALAGTVRDKLARALDQLIRR
jgi:hypothetical protein